MGRATLSAGGDVAASVLARSSFDSVVSVRRSLCRSDGASGGRGDIRLDVDQALRQPGAAQSRRMPNAFDFSASPFDCLDADEQQVVRDRVDIAYFREGETLLDPGIEPTHLFVVIKGRVSQFDAARAASPPTDPPTASTAARWWRAVPAAASSQPRRSWPIELARRCGPCADRAQRDVRRAAVLGPVEQARRAGAAPQPARAAVADDVEGRGGLPAPGSCRRGRHRHRRRRARDAGRAREQRAGARRRSGSASSRTPACSARSSTADRSLHCRCASWRASSWSTIAPDAQLFDALALMIEHQVHRLVVVGRRRRRRPARAARPAELPVEPFVPDHACGIVRAPDLDALCRRGRQDHALRRPPVPRRHADRPDRQAGADAQREAVRARLAAGRAGRSGRQQLPLRDGQRGPRRAAR